MAAVRVVQNSVASRVWLGDKSAWPVIAVIGGAVALCAGSCTRFLTSSPDVQWDRSSRGATMRLNFAEGQRWTSHKHGLSLPRDEVSKIGLMPGLNETFGK